MSCRWRVCPVCTTHCIPRIRVVPAINPIPHDSYREQRDGDTPEGVPGEYTVSLGTVAPGPQNHENPQPLQGTGVPSPSRSIVKRQTPRVRHRTNSTPGNTPNGNNPQ